MPDEEEFRLLDLVAEALAIDPELRKDWLTDTCGDDRELRAEIETLLGFNSDADNLLQLRNAATYVNPALPPRAEIHGEAVGAFRSGDRLGDYQIEKQIGAGGMGIVYEAKQLSLNRSVALKVLPAYLRNSSNALARFTREVEAAARLRHQNIVAVYTTGDDGSTSYYAMELIEGPSLSEVLAGLRRDPIPDLQLSTPLHSAAETEEEGPAILPAWSTAMLLGNDSAVNGESTAESRTTNCLGGNYFEVVASMLAEVADGLEYAHHNQIVHRDIKPSNLLLSEDGHLHISDFGLARIMSEPGVTQSGDLVGTPFYMAPEQISSTAGEIDCRTDIYALGATLYELLTLRPPFPGSNRDEVLASIARQEPTSPKRLNKRVPRDLETICLKASEKNPSGRYQTAGQLADDLRRFVARLPIEAKRIGVAARSLKWCRRHPSMAASLLVACSLGVVATGLAYSAHESTKDKVIAEQQRDSMAAHASKIEQDLDTAKAAVIRARQTEQERIFEQALLAAMQGDEVAAQAAVQEAEQLGASAGRLHVMRGQIALFSASFRQALEELDAAVRLMPDNLAAHALLAETQARRSQWSASLELLEKVRAMEPSSIEDLILKGRLESYHDTKSAEKTLDQAISRDKKNLAARLIRGIIRGRRAYDTGDRRIAERALEDFRLASTFLERTPYLLSELLSAHLTAAAAYEAAGENGAEQRHLEQAGVIVEKLGQFEEDYQAHRWRAFYFDQVGELENSLNEWRAIKHRSIGFFVMALFRAGHFEEALTVCDEYSVGAITGTADFCHSFVESATCQSADQLEADFRFEKLRSWDRNAAWRSTYILWCLAGHPDRASNEVRELGITNEEDPRSRVRFEYLSGEISASEYLQRTETSRYEQGRAHSVIGVACLARGQREAARKHFERAVEFRFNYNFFTATSRALLAQLERDPSWPPWIP